MQIISAETLNFCHKGLYEMRHQGFVDRSFSHSHRSSGKPGDGLSQGARLNGLIIVNQNAESLEKAKRFVEKHFSTLSTNITICTDPVKAIILIEDEVLDLVVVENQLTSLDSQSLLKFIKKEKTASRALFGCLLIIAI